MKNYIILLLSFASLAGCKTPDYLTKPKDYKYNVNGSYVEVKSEEVGSIVAEIIVVTDSSIVMLSTGTLGNEIIKMERNNGLKFDIIVSGTSDAPNGLSTWGGMLPLTSIGHGYLMVFSLPINIVSAAAIGADVQSQYRIKYPDKIDWKRLKKFARYPQGLPEGVDLGMIK